MIVNVYFAFATPSVGPSTPQADAVPAVIFLTGLAISAGSYYYNDGRGVDLRLIHPEIPPE